MVHVALVPVDPLASDRARHGACRTLKGQGISEPHLDINGRALAGHGS